VQAAWNSDVSVIDEYFQSANGKPFAAMRDTLLKDPQLAGQYPVMPASLTGAATQADFDTALKSPAGAGFVAPISPVAKRLTPSPNPS
jgi:hypothetical protein